MKFKVFEQHVSGTAIAGKLIPTPGVPAPGFYYHARNGSKVNLPSQRYPTLAHAIRAVEQLWFAFAKAQKHPDAYMTLKEFVAANPIPYARDSLKPKPKKLSPKAFGKQFFDKPSVGKRA